MKITIPKTCHENWDLMSPSEKGRFCSVCRKTVKDFTKLCDEEIIHDLESDSNICANLTACQLNRNLNYSFINSLFSKFAVGVILTSGGISTVNAQQAPKEKDTASLNIRDEISDVSPIKKGKVKISEGFRTVCVPSLKSDNIPLYILDGKIITENKMKILDQNSIERVDILKGPSAAALYGIRGQNGAIIITSKSQVSPPKSKSSK